MGVQDLIAKDKRARRLLRMIKKNLYSVSVDNYIKEIEQLHINRRGRNMTVQDVLKHFQSKFLDALLHTQANRSRLAEIKMRAFKVHAKLDIHIGLVRQHIKSTYGQQLSRSLSTAADRESIISAVLEPAMRHLKTIKIVMDMCDMAINDLDQIGWNHKSVIKVMEINSERKTAKI